MLCLGSCTCRTRRDVWLTWMSMSPLGSWEPRTTLKSSCEALERGKMFCYACPVGIKFLTHCIRVKVPIYATSHVVKKITLECNHPHLVSFSRLPYLWWPKLFRVFLHNPLSVSIPKGSLLSSQAPLVHLWDGLGSPWDTSRCWPRLAVSLKTVGEIHINLVDWNFDPWQPVTLDCLETRSFLGSANL